jgi:hypothetical protein
VWAELEANTIQAAGTDVDVDVDALLAAWHDDGDETWAEQRYTIVLGDVPTNLLIEAKAHIDNLVREFSLAASTGGSSAPVPEDLARLIQTVVHGFADARDAIKRQALAAAQRQETRTRLTLSLPLSAADAGEAYLTALDETDAYARAARLLTLETPVAHRLFRRWYVGAVIRQLREAAGGGYQQPVVPFEVQVLEELELLASARRVAERAARLQRVTAALARARTPEDVASVVVSEGVRALGASGGGLVVPASDGEHLSVPGAVGYEEQFVDALREERLDAPLPAATALRSGTAVWLESQEERDREFPALRGFEAATVSMCVVPLVVASRTLGALRFSFGSRRLFDDDERSFVLALAAQTGQTLLRTELYAAERQASLSLQRALLPDDAPDMPGWSVASHYSPAGGQETGGDFYDVLPLRDGRYVAVVGDVMGRGVEAAAAMAQVRTMIRAYAIDDPDPSIVFGKVDAYFETVGLAQFVTALYLLIDPATGIAQLANAGHLPPLLVDRFGARMVPSPVGTPFGIGDARRTSTTFTIVPGAAVVAVTDGLVERRGEDIDVGLSRLTDAASGAGASSDASVLLQRVIAAAGDTQLSDDDVTVLVLRRR